MDRHVGGDPSQPALVRQPLSQGFRISEVVENPIDFSEREQRAPTGEFQIDGRLAGRLSLGKVLEHGQRSLEMRDGLAWAERPAALVPASRR